MSLSASDWYDKSLDDLDMVRRALEPSPGQNLGGAAYHVQQAAEKLLKGYLTHIGVAVPRTHDIATIAAQIPHVDPLKADAVALDAVTPWATTFSVSSRRSRNQYSSGTQRCFELEAESRRPHVKNQVSPDFQPALVIQAAENVEKALKYEGSFVLRRQCDHLTMCRLEPEQALRFHRRQRGLSDSRGFRRLPLRGGAVEWRTTKVTGVIICCGRPPCRRRRAYELHVWAWRKNPAGDNAD